MLFWLGVVGAMTNRAAGQAVPMPPELRTELQHARTDSARFQIHFNAVRVYTGMLDSAGIVGNLHACRALGRRLGDSVRVGIALSSEGMFNVQARDLRRAARLLRQADATLRLAADSNRAQNAYFLGNLYNVLNRPEQALAYGRQAMHLNRTTQNPGPFWSQIYFLLGTIHLNQGRVDSAVYLFQRGLVNSREEGDSSAIASSLNNLAGAFLRHQNLALAQRYARQGYDVARLHHDTIPLLTSVASLGNIALRTGRPVVARRYLLQLVQLSQRLDGLHRVADAYSRLGLVYEQLHQPDSARYYHRLASQLALAQHLPTLGEVLVNQAGFEQRQQHYPQAEALARQALALDEGRPNSAYSQQAWQVLRAAAERRGDFAAAYRLLRQEQDYLDAHQRQENQHLIENLRISYEAEETEQQVRALQQSQELTRLRNRQQVAGISGSALLLLLLLGGGFWQYRRRQQAARLAAATALRQRLAADLHDDVGNLLTQIGMHSSLLRETPHSPAQTEARLDALATAARQASQQMSDVVWGLDAEYLSLSQLLARMRDHAQEVLPPAGLDVRFQVPADLPDPELAPAVGHNLYLIYKEALHNVVKHAQATLVTVQLAATAAGLALTVADNGRGHDGQPRPGGHGLANMQARAQAVGGTVRCAPQPQGFAVMVSLPLG
jgi:signal transduction histidine kinase